MDTATTISLIVILSLIGILIGLLAFIVWASYQPGGLTGMFQKLGVMPMPRGPYLLVTLNTGQVRTIPLQPGREVTIGRESGNDIVIDNHLVSRRHARIFYDPTPEGGRWLIEDNSVNGTFQNGHLIPHQAVLVGNEPNFIEIGPAQIRLVLPQDAQTDVVMPPSEVFNAHTTHVLPNSHPGRSTGDSDNLSRQMLGRFVVVRVLGEGGMSQVLLGQDTMHQQQLVAIKVLNHSNEFLGEKFRQEGGLRLDHPHIIRVIEMGEVNDRPFIVMEYVEGAPLRKLLNGRPVPLDVALSVIGQVLAALEYAHQQQVVHRDIKPSNIMIVPHEGVKVIDFGIAKLLSSVTRTQDGLLLGTPQYMSFEQAQGLTVNPTSDQYSAAIVLYEMLTGNIPFSGNNPLDIVRQHLQNMPLPPRRLNPDIPGYIEDALLRALEKDYRNRFASVREFAQALGCTPGQPIPVSFTQEAARYIVPATNERANAAELPTRVPPDLAREATTMRFLRVGSGSRQGQILHVQQGQIVGREMIDITDGTISRQHFQLDYQNGACILRNVSTYGTRVNSQQLGYGESCVLVAGALIHVGQTTLIYEERT